MRQIDIYRTEFKVSDFIALAREDSLDLSPSFQRRAVWSSGAKSYLIDTIVKGYPIPIIFLREKRTDLKKLRSPREVIDGQQRLRTIFTFIEPSLVKGYREERDYFLVQKTHNPEIANKPFRELEEEIQDRILNYQFSVQVLPSDVSDREVIQIFRRMNSTGYKLNGQELRNSEYFGKLRTLVLNLANEQLDRWRSWGIFTEDNIARMLEVELTSEFAQLMIQGIVGKSQSSLDRFYHKYNEDLPFSSEIARRFRIIMDSIDDKIGSRVKELPYSRKTVFFSLFAFFYDIQFGLGTELKKVKPNPISDEIVQGTIQKGELIKEGGIPKNVEEALSRRTTHPSSRNALLKYLHN